MPEETIRFDSCGARKESGFIKANPQQDPADGTDCVASTELKRELKA